VTKVGVGLHSSHHTTEVIHPGGGDTSEGGIVEAPFLVDVAVSSDVVSHVHASQISTEDDAVEAVVEDDAVGSHVHASHISTEDDVVEAVVEADAVVSHVHSPQVST